MAHEGRPRFEVADVVRAHVDEYRRGHALSAAQKAVLARIAACRTAVMGGHLDQCDSCGHQRISYNSCRDRHCPKCQRAASAEWVTKRLERLLPVPYFHVVFTIPDELNALALGNKDLVFDILFAAASQTLSTIAANEKRLGAQLGFTMVLHTWGQKLLFHPHVHAVVTGGGLSLDGSRWVAAREKYLLPVRVLSKLFRGKFMAALEDAHRDGKLRLAGSSADLADPKTWRRFKSRLYKKAWVVYAKPPVGGAEQVFRYLGQYTHRIAISNHRIVQFAEGKVTFTWKDYADRCAKKLMTIDAVEFIRRFLLHVIPRGFVRIRHYGLSAGGNVNRKLATARALLLGHADPAASGCPKPEPVEQPPWWERFQALTGIDVMACPCCEHGRMQRQRKVNAEQIAALLPVLDTPTEDSS